MSASKDHLFDDFADLAAYRPSDTIQFYEAEGKVLELWDQLDEHALERALLEAQTQFQSEEQSTSAEVTEEELREAEKEYLEARAAYMLKQSVVKDVLVADPILKAVHAGENATSTERHVASNSNGIMPLAHVYFRDLHPLIGRRDTLEIAYTNLNSTLQSLLMEITRVERDKFGTMEKNKALTANIQDLTQRIKQGHDRVTDDPSLVAELDQVSQDAAAARCNWRIMKSATAAIVAGSGVDWARDDTLRGLVLDEEEID